MPGTQSETSKTSNAVEVFMRKWSPTNGPQAIKFGVDLFALIQTAALEAVEVYWGDK
jgi:hypothetical protein